MDNSKTTYVKELFTKMPEELQDRFIALLQFLLTEQESSPDIQE